MSDLEYISFKANTDLSNKLIDLEVKVLGEGDYHYYTLTFEELIELVDGKKFLFGYCNHILRNHGTYIEMFNVETLMKSFGEVTSKYVRFNFTPFIKKFMLRVICNHYKRLEFDSEYRESNKYNRVEFKIDNCRLARWDKLYTQGSGGVDLHISEETQAKLDLAIAADKSSTLKEQIARMFQMAKNQTYTFWEKGRLELYSSWGDEFGFRCAGMTGGIINHDSGGVGSWSTHT
jgi:hypothetical protein